MPSTASGGGGGWRGSSIGINVPFDASEQKLIIITLLLLALFFDLLIPKYNKHHLPFVLLHQY